MYSLDINFLKDRASSSAGGGEKAAKQAAPKRKMTTAELLPVFIGGGVAVLCLAGAGLAYAWVGWQTAQTQEQLAILDGEIQALQQKQAEIDRLRTQVESAQRQTDGLAQIFARILPWSAIIEDIRARIPQGVQLLSFNVQPTEVQEAPAAGPAGTPAPPPQDPAQAAAAATGAVAPQVPAPPMPTIVFSGYAESYDQVNFFLITLQRSAFINGDNAQITSAELVDDPNDVDVPEASENAAPPNQAGNAQASNVTIPEDISLPKIVKYTIEAQVQDLTALPSDQLITQLENKKNLGSVIRLKALRDKGIL
ncbi:MAG: PilN domain-containing protein [Spirulinaceae cyanobacterium]